MQTRQQIIIPRPPLWEKTNTVFNKDKVSLQNFKKIQAYFQHATKNEWDQIHNYHFDWWMFPIDDGSKSEYRLGGEQEVQELKNDQEWFDSYIESIEIVSKAWGWDLKQQCRIRPQLNGMEWTFWDIRLAKMIRSLWIFEVEQYMKSLQKFALDLQQNEKKGKSFQYNYNLDEILYMKLPREKLSVQQIIQTQISQNKNDSNESQQNSNYKTTQKSQNKQQKKITNYFKK